MSTPCLVKDQHLSQFLDYLWLEKGLSDHTLSAYRNDIVAFASWLNSQSVISFCDVKREHVLSYLAKRLKLGYKARSTARLLSSLRHFYRYLKRQNYIENDPTNRVDAPKPSVILPKIINEIDVDSLLSAPDVSNPLGVRDKSMLELLYACGLRVSELINLSLPDINLQQGVVRVTGKGNKERLVPMGEAAVKWLRLYYKQARSELIANNNSPQCVYVSQRGKKMTRQTFWYRIKHHAKVAGIAVDLSPHTLRHAFATHLINHGADLRVVQLLLGHSDLSTTQIYTHIAKHRLMELHKKHHPRG